MFYQVNYLPHMQYRMATISSVLAHIANRSKFFFISSSSSFVFFNLLQQVQQ